MSHIHVLVKAITLLAEWKKTFTSSNTMKINKTRYKGTVKLMVDDRALFYHTWLLDPVKAEEHLLMTLLSQG